MKNNLNDIVYTPHYIAKKIINHFKPKGKLLDPCKGGGAFYNYMPEPREWCEIQEGIDFMLYTKHVDWIITNPPFSIYSKFLKKALEVADNVVFLIPISKILMNWTNYYMVEQWGGMPEILVIGPGTDCGFNFGFITGAVYYKKGYKGPTQFTRLNLLQEEKLFK